MSRKTVLLPVLLLALVIAIAGVWTGTADATPPEPGCTMGAAMSALQAGPVGAWNVGESRGGVGYGVENCRLAPYLDGESFSFNSSDHILVGYTNFIPYEFLGMSKQEGKALLLTSQETIDLGPSGNLVEQDVVNTAVKTFHHPDLGRIVYQGIGVVVQLEPGDYEIYFTDNWIYGPEQATTYLTILP